VTSAKTGSRPPRTLVGLAGHPPSHDQRPHSARDQPSRERRHGEGSTGSRGAQRSATLSRVSQTCLETSLIYRHRWDFQDRHFALDRIEGPAGLWSVTGLGSAPPQNNGPRGVPVYDTDTQTQKGCGQVDSEDAGLAWTAHKIGIGQPVGRLVPSEGTESSNRCTRRTSRDWLHRTHPESRFF
jgi:hypothetical protein